MVDVIIFGGREQNIKKKRSNSRIESSAETHGFRVLPLLPPEPLFDRFTLFTFLTPRIIYFPFGLGFAMICVVPSSDGHSRDPQRVNLCFIGTCFYADAPLLELLEGHDTFSFWERWKGEERPVDWVN